MPLLIFSERLRHVMESEKISNRKLSIKTGISRKSIASYQQGICLPRYDALTKIADFFELSTDFLLGIEEECFYCYITACKTEDIPALFTKRLGLLMKDAGLSQGKLAKALKMQQASISKWLRLKTMPETFVIMDIAKFFDCKTDYLLGRERQ